MIVIQRFNHRKLINRIPEESGVLLLNVDRFTPSELQLVDGRSLADFSRVNRIGAGTMGGDLSSVLAWHRAYYDTFQSYKAGFYTPQRSRTISSR